MELWYALLSCLPFDWVQYQFMKNALLAVCIVAPVFGIVGTMVIGNQMAFFSDAIGHAALTGIGIGVLMGLGDPLWAMLIFAAILAAAITWVRIRTQTSTDTVIGVFFATAVALGVVILSRGGGFSRYSRYLIGDILSITPGQILLLLGVFFLVLVLWLVLYNSMFLTSINPTVARSRNIKVLAVEMIFAVAVALVVTVSIQWVGLLIINALLILPAAAARNSSSSIRAYHGIAVLCSLLAGVAGLMLSYYWGTATGATIVLVLFIFYIISITRRLIRVR